MKDFTDVGMDIIGGYEVAQHSRPYMALLMLNGECGGALIRPTWILSAAHCNVDSTSYAVLGAHRREDARVQKIRIKRGIKFPLYDKVRKINDIQLLELEKSVMLNKFVALLPLPKSEKIIQAGKSCSVAGWGITDVMTKSNVLREVNLAIVDNKDCNKKYNRKNLTITGSMMCASSPKINRKAGPCAGDSGGPLICDGTYVGLVSYGIGNCGNPEFPGVYTRLTNNYLKWISNIIGMD
ncbi:granzyme A-like isoform X2 [Phyllobates terribilis]|uniref:granzyme A-like isoform X2 n=1 Tax=Phyllobates terribilis TaxID=111132 RepID=UPI003CCA9B1C